MANTILDLRFQEVFQKNAWTGSMIILIPDFWDHMTSQNEFCVS